MIDDDDEDPCSDEEHMAALQQGEPMIGPAKLMRKLAEKAGLPELAERIARVPEHWMVIIENKKMVGGLMPVAETEKP